VPFPSGAGGPDSSSGAYSVTRSLTSLTASSRILDETSTFSL
jgi:hypothetical protein